MAIDGGLRKIFQDKLNPRGYHFQAIETGSTGRGIPDLNGCIDFTEFWIEFKKTSANAIQISPEQVAWILRRKRAGGNVYIAVRKKCSKGPRREAKDELWLIDGSSAADVKEHGLKPGTTSVWILGIWSGGPSKWDWEAVHKILSYKRLK